MSTTVSMLINNMFKINTVFNKRYVLILFFITRVITEMRIIEYFIEI